MIAPLIRKHATGWKTLIAFLAAQAVYIYMILVSIPAVSSYAGGLQLLDVKPLGYDYAYVETLMDKLGPEGRLAYKTQQIPVDMVYPILFGIALSLLMAYVLKRLIPEESPLFVICFLPFLAAALDYLENFGILKILNEFPSFSPDQVATLSQLTVWKSVITTLVFLIIIPSVLMWFFRKRESIKLF